MKLKKLRKIVDLVLKAVALAMGVAVAVLSVMGGLDAAGSATMLGIGLACLAVTQISGKAD